MDRRLVAGAVVALVAVVAVAASPGPVLDRLTALAADPLPFALAVAGLYLVRPLFAWPTALCSVAVGYGLGLAGLPLAMAGVVATAVVPFYATRWAVAGDGEAEGIPRFLAAPAGRARELGERFFAATGEVRGVTAAKLSPIPADVATCAAAASGVSLPAFVAGTLLGELPWTVAAVLVGASAGTIATDGLGAVSLKLGVAAGLGAALLLAGPAYRLLSDRGILAERGRADG